VSTDISAVSYSPFPVSTVWNESCVLTPGWWKRILQREIETARFCMWPAMAPWDEWWWFLNSIWIWPCFNASGSSHRQPPIRMLLGKETTVRIDGKWPTTPFQVLRGCLIKWGKGCVGLRVVAQQLAKSSNLRD